MKFPIPAPSKATAVTAPPTAASGTVSGADNKAPNPPDAIAAPVPTAPKEIAAPPRVPAVLLR